ncbi:MAG TPA: maleylpyruvate isomerase N-terminal domain-containing protein [Acidimicrobiales bacterium]|nr:maleylpyruvate isomerase N-terminal domain-containing protein [Acidimicrobiales bacterium]
MEGPVVDAYEQASRYFVSAVERVPAGAWAQPGLGAWTVRELVGHTNRQHLLIEEYLLRPVPEEPMDGEYFRPENIEARGRDAVALLGDDPLTAVKQASEHAVDVLAATPGDAFLGSPVRHQTLAEYVPSRVAELTIHTLDLTRAIHLDLQAPAEALNVTLEWTIGRAIARGEGERVLLALSGRGELPAGFSLY